MHDQLVSKLTTQGIKQIWEKMCPWISASNSLTSLAWIFITHILITAMITIPIKTGTDKLMAKKRVKT